MNRVEVMTEIGEGSRCAVCEERFQPGDVTEYVRSSGVMVHVDCESVPQVEPRMIAGPREVDEIANVEINDLADAIRKAFGNARDEAWNPSRCSLVARAFATRIETTVIRALQRAAPSPGDPE